MSTQEKDVVAKALAEVQKKNEAEQLTIIVAKLREAADRIEKDEEGEVSVLFAMGYEDRMSHHYKGNAGALCALLLFLQKSLMAQMP